MEKEPIAGVMVECSWVSTLMTRRVDKASTFGPTAVLTMVNGKAVSSMESVIMLCLNLLKETKKHSRSKRDSGQAARDKNGAKTSLMKKKKSKEPDIPKSR